MIQLDDLNQLNVVSGTKKLNVIADKPFSDLSLNFLDDLSNILRKSAEAKIYSDLMAFSFWCRKSNLKKLKNKQHDINQRLGRGLSFHITPSNVPLNFGYSFIFLIGFLILFNKITIKTRTALK